MKDEIQTLETLNKEKIDNVVKLTKQKQDFKNENDQMKLELSKYRQIILNMRNAGIDVNRFNKITPKVNSPDVQNVNVPLSSQEVRWEQRRDYMTPDKTENIKVRKYNSVKRSPDLQRSPPSCLKPNLVVETNIPSDQKMPTKGHSVDRRQNVQNQKPFAWDNYGLTKTEYLAEGYVSPYKEYNEKQELRRKGQKSGSVLDEYEETVSIKLKEFSDTDSSNMSPILTKNHIVSYSNEFEMMDVNEIDLSEDSIPQEGKLNIKAYWGRDYSGSRSDNRSDRSHDSSDSRRFKSLANEDNTNQSPGGKSKFTINLNSLKKSSKIPNIQVKNAKRSGNMTKNVSESNMKNVKSRFLQETASYSNRLQNSKEQIERNNEKLINEPKNFTTGKVREPFFQDFNKNDPINIDDFEFTVKPNYQIIQKSKPVKPINDADSNNKVTPSKAKYIIKKDKSNQPKRWASEAKR